jgi:ribonuclease Y
MIEASLLAVVLIATANLIAATLTLRSSLRSEGLGESRRELLREQQERLELLREERLTLLDELERESRERRQLMEYLEESDPRLSESLERRRQARVDNDREVGRLEQEHQQVTEELQLEIRRRLEIQQLVEQQEQELARLEQELQRSQAAPDRRKSVAAGNGTPGSGASRPWWRRPLPVVGLLVGILITWFVSLTVALSMLAP